MTSIFASVFVIAETFFGWETATFLAEETKDGARVMPKVLIYGTVIIMAISVLFVGSTFLASSWEPFSESQAPLSFLAGVHYGPTGGTVFTLLVYVAILGSVAGWIISSPRMLLSMARDKLFLTHFARIHPKRKTPHNAILFQTIFVSVLVVMGSGMYERLLHLLVPLALIMYSFVLMSLVILRHKKPNIKRTYKAPFGKSGPIITVVILLFFIFMWMKSSTDTWAVIQLGLSLVFMGVPLYLLIEVYYDPKMITEASDVTAYSTLFTEGIVLPKSVRKEVMKLIGDIKEKVVLEYGCSVGTMTLYLAEKVGVNGVVYAVDLSINDLRITRKRIDRLVWASHERIHGKVRIIHDIDQIHRVHPSIPYADAVVSIGMLSYIQDIKRVLSELHSIMPNEGKICFVEYGDFFKVIPNVEWLSKNETIERIFREAGFSVRVLRKKGLFWNYIFVYGMKFTKDIPFI